MRVTQQKRGFGRECTETPGKWREHEECDTGITCPTDPPGTTERTRGPGGIGVRSDFGGKQLFLNVFDTFS